MGQSNGNIFPYGHRWITSDFAILNSTVLVKPTNILLVTVAATAFHYSFIFLSSSLLLNR